MRKSLTVATLLSVLALFTFGGSALAGCCSGKASSDASCGTMKSAGSDASCSSKSGASAAKLSCDVKSQASNADFFLSSYINVKSALHKGSCANTESAVSAWKSGVVKLIESGEAAEHNEHLNNLIEVLDAWPSDIEAQRSSFQKLSNWTIGYMEMFPERCQGAEVKTSSESGHRWVETQDVAGDPYSS